VRCIARRTGFENQDISAYSARFTEVNERRWGTSLALMGLCKSIINRIEWALSLLSFGLINDVAL